MRRDSRGAGPGPKQDAARDEDAHQHEHERVRLQPDRRGGRGRLADRVPATLEAEPGKDAGHESEEADERVAVSPADPLEHPERAAQEDEGADSHPDAEDEPGPRVAAGPRDEPPAGERGGEGAEDQAHDLGTQVRDLGLDALVGLRDESQRAGGVAEKARAANPHVARVAGEDERRRKHAHEQREPDPDEIPADGLLVAQHFRKVTRHPRGVPQPEAAATPALASLGWGRCLAARSAARFPNYCWTPRRVRARLLAPAEPAFPAAWSAVVCRSSTDCMRDGLKGKPVRDPTISELRVTRGRAATSRAIILCALMLTAGPGRYEGELQDRADDYARVAHLVTREVFERLDPVHRELLVRRASQDEAPPVACCFEITDEPDWTLMQALEAAMTGGQAHGFQWYSRWSLTAGGTTGTMGDPVTLRYSFVPDGTVITGAAGELPTPSNLFATFNPIYGGAAAWQAHFAAVFQRWSQLSGVTWVLEPNDDGAPLSGATPGILGVRGDIRIGGHNIDGQFGSNILAYNTYPNFGDMVIDTSNLVYFGSLANNALNLRNTASHEAGHGLGLAHVCPWNFTKLMEPLVSNAFDGPQHDDIQGAQWGYGDSFENNDTQATATDLGFLPEGLTTLTDVSCNNASDNDWYAFATAGPHALTVTMTPIGFSYLEGPEGGSCSTGAATNSLVANDLGVSVHDASGAAIATSNASAAGLPETIPAFSLPGSGTFWIRVFPGATSDIQMYKLDVTILPIASGSSVGAGCGSGTTIPILATTTPVLGLTTSITVTNAKPNHSGSLVASYGVASPSPLGSGCTAWVDLASFFVVAAFATSGSGSWTLNMPLPLNPALGGIDVALQAVVFSPASALGIDVSNGLSCQIGY